MESVTVSIRMEKDLKDRFEQFCQDVGLTMESAICVFAAKAARENRIPFEVSGDIPNAKNTRGYRGGAKDESRSYAGQNLHRRGSNVPGSALRCRCVAYGQPIATYSSCRRGSTAAVPPPSLTTQSLPACIASGGSSSCVDTPWHSICSILLAPRTQPLLNSTGTLQTGQPYPTRATRQRLC